METSGEVGERESVTIVFHCLHQKFSGDAYKDCMRKAGEIGTHTKPFFNRDCAVEAG